MAERASVLHKKEVNKPKELLSGSLDKDSFFDICREISLPKWTGVLVVKSSKTEFRFYFKKGEIIYSENSRQKTEEIILEMIRNSGLISRETISSSEKKKSKLMRTLLEILVEDGHVSMLLYSKIISAAVKMNVLDALVLKKGKYSFTERSVIREVHGVKIISILEIRDVANIVESHNHSFKKVTGNFFNYVGKTEKDCFLKENKTIFQNYLMCEIDFFKFVNQTVTGLSEKKWEITGKFFSLPVMQTMILYLFRFFVILGVFTFLYLAFITGSFEKRTGPVSVKDFYFFKANLVSSLLELETGSVPDKDELVKSGLLSLEEVDMAGISDKKKE